MKPFKNKTIIITGASRGIGAATAKCFAEHDANVVLVARSSDKINENMAAINQSCTGKALAISCDVSDYANLQKAVNQSIDTFGGVDFLVNNAGVIDPIARLDQSEPDQWSKMIDINIKGVYNGMHTVLPHMIKQGHGTIINLSSGAATNALEGWSHYCTSKAAVKMLTMAGHKEYAEHGISTIGLSPGTVATDMMAGIKSSGINPVNQLDWSAHIPPEWPARAIAFLCSDKGKEFSGTDFSIKTPEGRALVGLE